MKSKALSTMVLLSILLGVSVPDAWTENQRGQKGAITKEQMLSIFKAGDGDPDKGWVDGYVVKGSDVIEIIRDTKYSVRIKNSIIKGELDFAKLPAKSLDALERPSNWEKERWDNWQNIIRHDKEEIRIIPNRIDILASDIDSVGNLDVSLVTLFYKEVSFTRSTFKGDTSLIGAIFNENADFKEANFGGITSFWKAAFRGDAVFESSTFTGNAVFGDVTFKGNAGFWRATFNGNTVFDDATFSRDADFWRATFGQNATFRSATFSGNADFRITTFSDDSTFEGVTFNSGAVFNGATFTKNSTFGLASFSQDADFTKTVFNMDASFVGIKANSDADFTETTIKGNACFDGAKFGGNVGFWRATLSGNARFEDAKFSGNASFGGATFRRNLIFKAATFTGKASFDGATFDKDADFSKTVFSGNAQFNRAAFSGDVGFDNATFKGDTTFSETHFYKTAHFKKSLFSNNLNLDMIKSKEYTDFRDTTINHLKFSCKKIPTILESRVDFRNSEISDAIFEDIIFEKDIDFSSAKVGLITFRFITFESNASFIRTKFIDRSAFERVNFQKEANFTEANFKTTIGKKQNRFCLSHANFHTLFLNWDQLPHPDCWIRGSDKRVEGFLDSKKERLLNTTAEHSGSQEIKEEHLQPLSQIFKQLETIFRKSGQLEDANEAYFFRKHAELREARNGDSNHKGSRTLEWIFWGLPTGYGTKFLRVALLCIGFNLLFALIYFFGSPTRKRQTGDQRDFTFKQRFFDFPRQFMTVDSGSWTNNEALNRFANSLRLSSVVLFKFGHRDTTISGKFLGINYKYIIWVEWVLGFFLLAFLVVTMSNTFPLLHRLVTAVAH